MAGQLFSMQTLWLALQGNRSVNQYTEHVRLFVSVEQANGIMKCCGTRDMIESILDSLKNYLSVICELNAINYNASYIEFYKQVKCTVLQVILISILYSYSVSYNFNF